VEVTPPDPRGYAKVKQAAPYAGVSERTFRDWLKEGLPHFRLSTGTILIAYKDIDAWMQKFRVDEESKADAIVDELMRGLK
jgi:excisionase family DNA binding protein